MRRQNERRRGGIESAEKILRKVTTHLNAQMSFNSTKSTKKWTEDEIKERKRLAVRKVKAKRTDSVAKYQNFSLPDLDPDGGEAEEKNEEKREEERKDEQENDHVPEDWREATPEMLKSAASGDKKMFVSATKSFQKNFQVDDFSLSFVHDKLGYTLLQHAVRAGQLNIIDCLINEFFVDVNTPKDLVGRQLCTWRRARMLRPC